VRRDLMVSCGFAQRRFSSAYYDQNTAASHEPKGAATAFLLCCVLFGRPMLKVSVLVRLAQLAFFSALGFTFYSAVIPPEHALQLVPWDKASISSPSMR